MIHQELSIIPELSVAENLFLGRPPMKWGRIDWKRMYESAQEQLARMDFVDIDVRAPLERYPLGVQQAIEILRTINSGARILIMDEPTSALSPKEVENSDPHHRHRFEQTVASIVYISHFIAEVLRVADRITVLRDGSRVATLRAKDTDFWPN